MSNQTSSSSTSVSKADGPQSSSSSTSVSTADGPLLAALSSDLLKLYTEQTATDVTLNVQKRQFRAHRFILYARSPVFKAMLESEMSEKQKGTVSISDLDKETVDRLLRFLYTGSVGDLEWKSALKFYYAGDKYQIVSLKDKCRAFITSCLSALNVCEALSLADMHADEDLKKTVQDFIYAHKSEVFRSDQWKRFVNDRPDIAAKIMLDVFLKDDDKGIKDAQQSQLTNKKIILVEKLLPHVRQAFFNNIDVERVFNFLYSKDLDFLQQMVDKPQFRADKIRQFSPTYSYRYYP